MKELLTSTCPYSANRAAKQNNAIFGLIRQTKPNFCPLEKWYTKHTLLVQFFYEFYSFKFLMAINRLIIIHVHITSISSMFAVCPYYGHGGLCCCILQVESCRSCIPKGVLYHHEATGESFKHPPV